MGSYLPFEHNLTSFPDSTYLFKVTNKDSSTTPFWCLYCELWTNFTHCFGVSNIDFEQVNTSWDWGDWYVLASRYWLKPCGNVAYFQDFWSNLLDHSSNNSWVKYQADIKFGARTKLWWLKISKKNKKWPCDLGYSGSRFKALWLLSS